MRQLLNPELGNRELLTGWRGWLWWTFAMACFPLLAWILRFGQVTTGDEVLDIVVFLASGAACAAWVVAAQWLVLRHRVAFLAWGSVTVLGWVLGLLLQILVFQAGKLILDVYVPHFLHGVVFGAILGWLQTKALRPILGRSQVWLLTSSLSWSLAWLALDALLLSATLTGVPSDIADTAPQFLVLVAASIGVVIAGAITGAVMMRLLRRHEPSA